MAQLSGEWSQGFAAAGAALHARDTALAEADRMLIGVVADAYRIATDSIRRVEELQADIDGIASSAARDAHESARLLLECQRDLIAAVRAGRDADSAKTLVLQSLTEHYTG